jgi:large subunit ribosomal protein L15
MPAKKRKKNSRQRASTTHGWGARKKHRGSGNRGGQGMAGTGKRSDAKKTMIWKEDYFGKFGFKKKGQVIEMIPINIEQIEQKLDILAKENKVVVENGVFNIDITKLGYNKLLGIGMVRHKMKITTDFASAGAMAKIKKAGGEVVIQKEGSK